MAIARSGNRQMWRSPDVAIARCGELTSVHFNFNMTDVSATLHWICKLKLLVISTSYPTAKSKPKTAPTKLCRNEYSKDEDP